MIRIRVEWLDAPGVRDRVLARTWGRIVVEANGRLITEVADKRSDSTRGAIYGSAFPLADWVVERWWNLLFEPYRFPEPYRTRDLARSPTDREWVQRHCLLAAREGGALPDLMIFRDGPDVVARWEAEAEAEPRRPFLRFISWGQARMEPDAVENDLTEFVERVVERLDGVEDEDAKRIKSNWAAVRESREREPELCASAARLGLDPYDPTELTNDLIEVLDGEVATLESGLRQDLLDAAPANRLRGDLSWVRSARELARGSGGDELLQIDRPPSPIASKTAHDLGYRYARDLRTRATGISPDEPFSDITQLSLGGSPASLAGLSADGQIQGLVDRSNRGGPVFVSGTADEASGKFGFARALYLWNYASAAPNPRLLTEAHTWDQKASRAFAAELLAPAQALARRVRGAVPHREIEMLASEFGVSPWVIAHQIENHRIGWVESI